MKRREFITLLGGAAAAWPLAARGQQTKVYRIGALVVGNADVHSLRTELREALRKSGYVEGQNLLFEFRSADEQLDQLPRLATELAAAKFGVSPGTVQRIPFVDDAGARAEALVN